jgi:hypothetical protein
MFTTVHIRYTFIAFVCALLFMGALPGSVVHSQEEDATVTTTSEQAEESALTTSSVTPSADEYLETVYATEGIPGDPGVVVGDFVVGPGKIDLTLNPGESKVVLMNVTNRTGEKRKFNLTFEDAAGSRNLEQSIVLLGEDRGPYSIKDYLSVPSKTFILEHNMSARIPVTIRVPRDAEPGGLYGSVLVDTVAIEAKSGDTAGTEPQSAIVARIGTLFFVTVPGDIARDGALQDFSTIPDKTFYQSSPVRFGILFENLGTMHLAPYGEMRITNLFDEEVGYLELEPWFVLPDSLRLREVSWDREMLFGRYTATVYINRGYDDIVDEMSVTFWVLPWKPVLGIFAGLFLIFFIFRAFFRNFEFKRKR